MRCRVFQKYSAHRLVTTLSTHRHAAFWNTRHAVVFPMFQKWSFGASSRDSGRYVDADLKQTAIAQINKMAISFKTFTMPSLREIWVTSSTKRPELRHEDFWNRRHTAPRRLFQPPYPHEATGASSRRLLKHMAHSATPSVSKCACWALRHQYTSIQPISPRSAENFATKTLKQTARCAAPSVSKCESWVLRRQYISIQPIYPRGDGSFVTKTFEIHGTQRQAVCFKMCMLSAASPVYIHTTHLSTKRRELRHKDFWNRRHAVPRRLFQNVNLECCVANIYPYNPFAHEATGASSRRLLKHMAHSATPSVSKCAYWALRHQYASIQPISPRSAESFATKTFETDGTLCRAACFKMWILSAASPIYIHTTHLPTKRREFCHEDIWNTWHTAPRRLFQNVHIERCVTSIHPYNPSLHKAPRASSQRLLKQTARCAAPPVSKCQSWALRRQYKSKQPISPRSDGSFVTKTFETDSTQHRAVCFKMRIWSAASPIYLHIIDFFTKRPEFRHDDFCNKRHAALRRLFQMCIWAQRRQYTSITKVTWSEIN